MPVNRTFTSETFFSGKKFQGYAPTASSIRSGAPVRRGGPAIAPSPANSPPAVRESSAAPEASTEARFVTTGQCVRNEGTETLPRMTIVPCAPKAYEVLARFDGATNGEADAKAKCSKMSGYTNWYFFNSELDTLDFVLCLKLR